MILDRPLMMEEAAWLGYWKTVCGKCLGWHEAETEAWVKENIDDFDYHLNGWLYHQHPLERIQRLFVPEHLQEKFRLGNLNGLREFYDGLEDVLWLRWSEIYTGFSAEFDWDAAQRKIKHLTEIFAAQNGE